MALSLTVTLDLLVGETVDDAEGALLLDSVVRGSSGSSVLGGDDAHVAGFSPRVAPRVAHDPVLVVGVRVDAPADDRDDVVDALGTLLGVDAASVSLHLVGGVNAARNGAAREDLSLHLLVAAAVSKLADEELGVGFDGRAGGVPGRGASVALRLVGLGHLVSVARRVDSHVVAAGFAGNAVLFGVLVDGAVVTAVAGAAGGGVVAAGDHVLHGEHVLAQDGRALLDVQAVRERRGGTHGPAASAVHGDVLVAHGGEVVGAVDVGPGEVGGQVVGLQVRVRLRGGHMHSSAHLFPQGVVADDLVAGLC